MRALAAVVVVLGMGTFASAAQLSNPKLNPIGSSGNLGGTPDTPRTERTATAAPATGDYFAIDGAVWYRGLDGRTFVWQNRQWVAGDMPGARTAMKPVIDNPAARPAINPNRRFSRDPGQVISYPQDDDEGGLFKGNPFFGGGRGQFSS